MRLLGAFVAVGVLAMAVSIFYFGLGGDMKKDGEDTVKLGGRDSVKLPEPSLKGAMSVENALASRRSVRSFTGGPLALNELSQLFWSAQGKTASWGGRTAPSAGATYPLEVYAVVGDVEGIMPGVYRYMPDGHEMVVVFEGDSREGLAAEALGQEAVKNAPATIVIAAVYDRTRKKYGERGDMYVHMEAGHAGQNIYLQATALGLGTVSVGAFDPDGVRRVIGAGQEEEPIYLFPVGKA